MHALKGKELNEIATASDTAKTVTELLASRQRLRHVTDISRIRNDLVNDGQRIVDEDYMAFWKQLQTQKIGSVIYGRKGKPNRFEWHYSLRSVAQAALEAKDVQVDKLAQVSAEPVQETVQPKVEAKRGPGRPKGYSPKKAKEALQAKSETKISSEQLILVPIHDKMYVQIKIPAGATALDMQPVIDALKGLK